MINYFVTPRHADTIGPFLNTWPNEVRDLFNVVSYEDLTRITRVRPGIFIFSDLERLGPREMQWAEALADRLADRFGPHIILNHPRGLMLRAELLGALCQAGINHYKAFDFDDPGDGIRYPAFIRMANDHIGPITGLLHTPSQRRAALEQFKSEGRDPRQLITIEFCDTRNPDGQYQKFSAFRLGDRIVPAHVLISPDWITKDSGPEPMSSLERDYLRDNPHAGELKNIFDCARITYGRIDYGLHLGKIQVWEINTNPTLIQTRDKYAPDKLPAKQHLVDQLSDAFRTLHQLADSLASSSPARILLRLFYKQGMKPRARLHRILQPLKF